MDRSKKKEIPGEVQDKLQRKRFVLPKDAEAVDRLKAIQNIFHEAKKHFPEVVSFLPFGSAVKGYVNEKSDIDLWVVVDRNKVLEIVRSKMKPEEISDKDEHALKLLALEDKRLSIIINTIRDVFAHEFSIIDVRESLRDVKYFCVSEDIIREFIDDPESSVEVFSHLFLLAIGDLKKIRDWRKIIFDELEKQGEAGEEKWRRIAENMWKFERYGHDEEKINPKLYPLTIQDARKRFT